MLSEKEVIWKTNITPGMGFIQGPEGIKAREEALEHDKEKIYRVVVNIVGKERQGKTSLRRMFINEAFNEDEESTVGIEEDLVQTEGIAAKSTWNKIDLSDANREEFDVILSKHIKNRLTKGTSNLTLYIAPFVLFMKILLISYVTLFSYFYFSTYEEVREYPWVTCVLLFAFVVCGIIYGPRDGYGIAIGVADFIIHCDAIHRWNLHESFVVVTERTCFTFSLLLCALMYVVIESLIGFCNGTSIGLGLILAFCLKSPPFRNYREEIFPLKNIHVQIMILTSLVTIASLRYERVMFYVVGPAAAISVGLLPREYCYTLMFAVGCGHTHTLFIGVGQKLYVYLNDIVKHYIESRFYRRYMCHVGGLIPGILFSIFFQWTPAECLFLHILSVIIFLAVLEAINLLLGEKDTIHNPGKVVNVVKMSPNLKFIVRDFAGHPLYHSAHHVYMTGQNIYIVVFNLVEAKKNFEECYQVVLYWLQSIITHDRYPQVRTFIVGTHRDDESLSSEDLKGISERYRRELPRQFYNAIVWNENNNPIFFVENKVRDNRDYDHRKLKNKLSEIARQSEIMQKKYPIKLFYFYNEIEKYRQRPQLIERVDTVYELCKENTCDVKTVEEFENMLLFFHRSGEIIYNNRDRRLGDQIIFDPRAFVNLLSHVVTLPEFAHRHQDFIGSYEHLSETGVCSKDLLEHIISQTQWKTKLNFETIVMLLERFYLLFEIKFPTSSCHGQPMPQYIIPALIPNELLNPNNYWETEATDYIFYIWCEPSLPNPLFLKLIGQCAVDEKTEPLSEYGLWYLNISKVNAILTSGSEFAYKIELLDKTTDHPHNMMRIVIRSRGHSSPLKLLNDICRHMSRIIDEQFGKCRFKVTVACPFPGPHESSKENRFHLLTLADTTQFQNNIGGGIPEVKEFWCRGRTLRVFEGRIEQGLPPDRREAPEQVMNIKRKTPQDMWNVSLAELRADIYARVCDLLNIENTLQRDWRELAGRLEFTTQEVAIIKARCDKDPTDALLQDWTSRDQCATVGALVDTLRDMERHDVYSILEEYMT